MEAEGSCTRSARRDLGVSGPTLPRARSIAYAQRARERELLKRVDREEAEATARMEVKFADVERRQIERLQRSLEHEASRLLEDASREFHKTIRAAQEETARRLARELERAVTDLSAQGERLLRQKT